MPLTLPWKDDEHRARLIVLRGVDLRRRATSFDLASGRMTSVFLPRRRIRKLELNVSGPAPNEQQCDTARSGKHFSRHDSARRYHTNGRSPRDPTQMTTWAATLEIENGTL